ncbi:MAG: phosphomannomutase/phosphoglucomutase, partial [Psychrosphaera sp.]|nr:phosphomannomutase/phosphoglucomutase [Psychrosphaera sp.]
MTQKALECVVSVSGMRGIVGETIDSSLVLALAQAYGASIAQGGTVILGRDSRPTGPMLSQAVSAGLRAVGCDVIDIGRVPTPIMYFSCEELGTKSGVMVTGSHNPAEYNGLKIVLAGKTLSGPDFQVLYQRIEQDDFSNGQGTLNKENVVDNYIKRIVGDVKTTRSMKVVVDCGNGIAGAVAPKLLREFGCEVIELYCDVDGSFPNHNPNPSQEENLQDLVAAVQQHEAELGLAFDGDGDRLGVVDANGQPIWPDRLLVMFAQDILSREPEA